jgi:hypothetical protein
VHRKVHHDIWTDAKFRRLSRPTPSAQGLFINLLIGRHTCILPGVVIASPAEVFASLGWPDDLKVFDKTFAEGFAKPFPKGFSKGSMDGSTALAELVAENMVVVDDEAGLLYLPNGIKYNPPASPNHVCQYGPWWKMVPDCSTRQMILDDWGIFMKGLGENYHKTFEKTFLKGSPEGVPGVREQRTENREQRTQWTNAVVASSDDPVSGPDMTEVWKQAADESKTKSEPTPKTKRKSKPKAKPKAKPRRPQTSSKTPKPSAPSEGASKPKKPRDEPDVERAGTSRAIPQPGLPVVGAPEPEDFSDSDPPPHKAFTDTFHRLFEQHTGEPPVWGGKQGQLVSTVLKRTNNDLVLAVKRAKRMFAIAPKWPAEHPDLATLVGHWDKFAPPVKPGKVVERRDQSKPDTTTEFEL